MTLQLFLPFGATSASSAQASRSWGMHLAFLPCTASLFQLNFVCTKRRYFNFCEKYTIEVPTLKKIDINVKRRIVISDRLTFLWFVGTCSLSHLATGPQEALWNTVNEESKLIQPEKTRGLLCAQGTYCTGQEGVILVESTKIRWFLRQAGWGGWSLCSEAKSLKTTQLRLSGSGPLSLDGSHDSQAWGWTGCPAVAQGLYSLKLKPRGTIRLKSTLDEMVLMIVRWKTGPVA